MKTGKMKKDQLLLDITKLNQPNAQTERIYLPSEIIEATLPAGEKKYRDFVENAYDLIQSVDVNYKFLYVNRKWREVLDYNENEVKKLTLWDILRKDQIPRCTDFFKKVSEGKMLNQLETIFVAKNGEEKYVEGNVHGQFKDGKLVS